MHELSIAMSILEIAEEESHRHGDARVAAIHLKLGPLSGVVKAALISSFEIAKDGTDMQQCELIVEEVAIVVECPRCGVERSPVSMQQLCCEVCGAPTPNVIRGRELEVAAMEILAPEIFAPQILAPQILAPQILAPEIISGGLRE